LGTGFDFTGLAPGTYTASLVHTNGCTDVKTIEVGYSCSGCTDPLACNYSESANVDDESCTYAEDYYDCLGACLLDADGDGVCDELEVLGCTDSASCTYDSSSTDDDGSCQYLDNCGVCGGDNSCCPDLMTLSSTVSGCSGNDGTVSASVSSCSANENLALSILHQYMSMGPEMEYCVMMGDPFMCNMWGMIWAPQMAEDLMMSGIDYFQLMDALDNASSACTVSWSDEAGNDLGTGFDFTGLAPGTYTASLTHTNGCTDVKTIEVGYSCAGCTDPIACNYSEAANVDDESCTYAEGGIVGCTYEAACNFNVVANVDDGSCEYEGCAVMGCMYQDADNYNPEATEDNGSCSYESAINNAFANGYEAGLNDCPECPPTSDSCPEDLNSDGAVSTADLLIFLSAFGITC
jgi:hypothetical protein